MPINTKFEISIFSPFSKGRIKEGFLYKYCLQNKTWSVISSAVKFRLNPPFPVAQKAQFKGQPA